ncbi:hypothetical protein HK101_001687 [Irineochytrium annulatum]|nr:hypothetical protein HK101_001687 [Irineochytrium annulatum]
MASPTPTPISITASTIPTLPFPSCYRAINSPAFPFTSPNSSAPFGLPPSIFPASNNDPSLLCSPLCHSLATSVHADPAAVLFIAYNNQLKTGVPCGGLGQGDEGLCCKCLLLPDLEGVLLAPQVDDAACPLCVNGLTGRCSEVQAGLSGGSVVWIERVDSTAAFATGQVVSFVPFTTYASTSGVAVTTTTTAAAAESTGASADAGNGAVQGSSSSSSGTNGGVIAVVAIVTVLVVIIVLLLVGHRVMAEREQQREREMKAEIRRSRIAEQKRKSKFEAMPPMEVEKGDGGELTEAPASVVIIPTEVAQLTAETMKTTALLPAARELNDAQPSPLKDFKVAAPDDHDDYMHEKIEHEGDEGERIMEPVV